MKFFYLVGPLISLARHVSFSCPYLILFQIWIMAERRSHHIPKHAKKQIDQSPHDPVNRIAHAVKETATGSGQTPETIKQQKFGRDGGDYDLYGPGKPSSKEYSQEWGSSVELVHQGKTYVRRQRADL